MKKNIFLLPGKFFILGACFALGIVATTTIAITISSTFEAGDTLTATALNELRSAIVALPNWEQGDTTTDAVYLDGNVGIGTASPAGTLDVSGDFCINGNCKSSWDTFADLWSDSGDDIYFNSGNVGIGEDDPSFKLHVKNSGTSATVAGYALDNGQAIFGWSNTGHGVHGHSVSEAGGFFTTDSGYGLLVESGNVGIGTTTPAGILDVDGGTSDSGSGTNITLKAQDGYQTNDDGGSIILMPGEAPATGEDGNVGIGLAAPKSTLDVFGSFGTSAVVTVSTNTTLDESHFMVIVDTSGGTRTITLPSASGIKGRRYVILRNGTNPVTITPDGSEEISGIASRSVSTDKGFVELISDGSNWFIISGTAT